MNWQAIQVQIEWGKNREKKKRRNNSYIYRIISKKVLAKIDLILNHSQLQAR